MQERRNILIIEKQQQFNHINKYEKKKNPELAVN